MLTFDRGARPDAQCPPQVVGKLGVVVGIVDGEYAVHGRLAVQIPLYVFVYQTHISSLRNPRATTAHKHEGTGAGRGGGGAMIPCAALTPEYQLSSLVDTYCGVF